MPLTHQFFHLEDKLERALLRTSGVSSTEVGGGAGSARLSLSDAVSPSTFASDSDSLSSGGESGSRTALCLSSVMLETPARRSHWRAAQPPERAAQLSSNTRGLLRPTSLARPPEHSAAQQRLAGPSAARSPALELRPASPLLFHRSREDPAFPIAPPPGKSFGESAHAHSRHLGPGDPPIAGIH